MRIIGEHGCEFPDPDVEGVAREGDEWKPVIRRVALHWDVLCVARTRIEGKWAAYCGAVPGKNHDDEQADVLRQGGKLPSAFARVLFPQFDGIPYAR